MKNSASLRPRRKPEEKRLRVLFFVEGFTDIRFVSGLSETFNLTMVVPERAYRESGLKGRVEEANLRLTAIEIPGGRLAFQGKSLKWLWDHAREFDAILAQEMLRGALNATLVGRARGVPVVTYVGIAPVEYFRCRRERGQIGRLKAWVGETTIRALMTVNGRLAQGCLGMGPYLKEVVQPYHRGSQVGLYYGVDTSFFRPADAAERKTLRKKLGLPVAPFLAVLSSRISHEKDPETALRAAALARRRGLELILLNLGGGFQDFLALARRVGVGEPTRWVMGRAAVHPMRELADYFRAADCLVQTSLAEGAAFSTLEALACATPVIATDIGGMAVQLRGRALLTPRGDAEAVAEKLLWVASHRAEASKLARAGRQYVEREWNRERAFRDLETALVAVASQPE